MSEHSPTSSSVYDARRAEACVGCGHPRWRHIPTFGRVNRSTCTHPASGDQWCPCPDFVEKDVGSATPASSDVLTPQSARDIAWTACRAGYLRGEEEVRTLGTMKYEHVVANAESYAWAYTSARPWIDGAAPVPPSSSIAEREADRQACGDVYRWLISDPRRLGPVAASVERFYDFIGRTFGMLPSGSASIAVPTTAVLLPGDQPLLQRARAAIRSAVDHRSTLATNDLERLVARMENCVPVGAELAILDSDEVRSASIAEDTGTRDAESFPSASALLREKVDRICALGTLAYPAMGYEDYVEVIRSLRSARAPESSPAVDAGTTDPTPEQWDAMHRAFLAFTKRYRNPESWSIQPEYVNVLLRDLFRAARFGSPAVDDETVKPVLYLDVDGVLLRYPQRDQFESEHDFRAFYASDSIMNNGRAPNGLAEFLTWALANFECRWLSAWACSGSVGLNGVALLASHTGVGPELFAAIGPNLGWDASKCEGIDWTEHKAGRPWFWLDDDAHLIEREVNELRRRNAFDHLITVDTSRDADGLTRAREEIERRLAARRSPESAPEANNG